MKDDSEKVRETEIVNLEVEELEAKIAPLIPLKFGNRRWTRQARAGKIRRGFSPPSGFLRTYFAVLFSS